MPVKRHKQCAIWGLYFIQYNITLFHLFQRCCCRKNNKSHTDTHFRIVLHQVKPGRTLLYALINYEWWNVYVYNRYFISHESLTMTLNPYPCLRKMMTRTRNMSRPCFPRFDGVRVEAIRQRIWAIIQHYSLRASCLGFSLFLWNFFNKLCQLEYRISCNYCYYLFLIVVCVYTTWRKGVWPMAIVLVQ